MSREIHIAPFGADEILVALEGGKAVDCLYISQTGARDIGAIYMAKVERAIKGLGGTFVSLGNETAFLRAKRPYKEGALIPVQIQQFSSADKPLRVGDQIDYRGVFVVLTPNRPGLHQSRKEKAPLLSEAEQAQIEALLPENCGLILRSAAAFASFGEIKADVEHECARYKAVEAHARQAGLILPSATGARRAAMEWGDGNTQTHRTNLPDYVTEALANGLSCPLTLGEGYAYVEATRALIAVDVNTGAARGQDAARSINQMLADRLPQYLRMRGMGGQLVVDCAPMPTQAQKGFEARFLKAAKAARAPITPRGFGPLGLFEALVKTDRRPLPAEFLAALE